jgi:hypothetical protein
VSHETIRTGKKDKLEDRRGPMQHVLPASWHLPITALLLTGMMTALISGIATRRALGAAPEWPTVWAESWAWSWLTAFPAAVLLIPLARRAAGYLVRPAVPGVE